VHLREDAADHAVEAGCLVTEVAEHRPRQLRAVAEGAAVALLAVGVDLDQRARIPDRQFSERDLVEQREHRRVGADPERDRDHGDEAEERRAPEAPRRELEVRKEARHVGQS
jgi:hypothetical protein